MWGWWVGGLGGWGGGLVKPRETALDVTAGVNYSEPAVKD